MTFIASDIRDRPMKINPRPDNINPVFCRLSLLQTMVIIIPINTQSCIYVVTGNALSAAI